MTNLPPSDPTVAQNILAQLGGVGPLKIMIGARDFLYTSDFLQFRIGSNERRIQYVQIKLDASDTYTVTASRFDRRKLERVTIEEQSLVYADQLVQVVETMLGMTLALPTIRRASPR